MREDMGITLAWTSAKTLAGHSSLAERLIAPLRALVSSAARPQTRLLRHVETLSLGQKRSLYLVECDGERFLISAGNDSLSAPVPIPQKAAGRSGAAAQEDGS